MRVIFKKAAKMKVLEAQEEVSSAAQEDGEGEEKLTAVASVAAKDTVESIAVSLYEYGILDYFKTRNRSAEESKIIVKRYAHFLCWSYSTAHNAEMMVTTNNIVLWLVQIIKDRYEMLLHYSSYLQERKQLSAATVTKYIAAIESCCVWVTLFAPVHLRLPMSDIEGIRRVAQLVRANQSQRNKQVRSHITLEEKVRLGQLPAGGLSALQHAVLREVPWARGVRQRDIDDVAYRKFMQLLFAALYVCSPNGRQSGVVDIKFRQADELLHQCYTTSTQFKTYNKYGFQPVIVEGASHELVAHYVEVIRPQVRRPLVLMEPHDEPLWLTYTGEKELDVGRLVTSFFTRTCGLSVTITAIRSLVETTMHKKHKEGKITDAQRMAVQNINGHSSATTKAYYLLEERADDVLCSRGVLADDLDAALGELAADLHDDDLEAHLHAEPAHLPVQLPLPLPLPGSAVSPAPMRTGMIQAPRDPRSFTPTPQLIDWGTSHPDYNTSKETAIWTYEEKSFLGRWCSEYRAEYPDVKFVVAKCLKHIRTNSDAIRIFHKHHTLNSARLRNGHRQYERDLQEEQEARVLRTHVHDNDDMY